MPSVAIVSMPDTVMKEDRFSGRSRPTVVVPPGAFSHQAVLSLTWTVEEPNVLRDTSKPVLKVSYQGCSKEVCFLPAIKRFEFDVAIGRMQGSASGSITDKIGNAINEAPSIWMLLLLALLGGLLSALTPCVYPVIPITVAVLGSRAQRSRAVLYSSALLFCLSLSLSFAGLGVFAVLTGGILGLSLQSPMGVWGVVLFFVLFGFSMLGIVPLRMPSFLLRSTDALEKVSRTGGFVEVVASGLITGIVAAPCVGPVILALLLSLYLELQLSMTRRSLLNTIFSSQPESTTIIININIG